MNHSSSYVFSDSSVHLTGLHIREEKKHKKKKKSNQNSPSSPNCSYATALLPLPHHSVPGNTQARFLRVFPSVPSLLKLLVNFGALGETSTQGESGASSTLILNIWRISSCVPLLSQSARYLSVTGEFVFTSHVTRRTSSDHRLRYRERTPAVSSRRNVTLVSPSPAGLDLRQETPDPIIFCAFDEMSDDEAKRTSNRHLLCISM